MIIIINKIEESKNHMKRSLWGIMLIICLVIAGCGGNNGNADGSNATGNNVVEDAKDNEGSASNDPSEAPSEEESSGEATTQTYETAAGEIEIPADPQRVVVLSGSYAGHALFLDAPVIAVDSFTYANPLMKSYLDDVVEVSADNLEQIIELDPDLIITDDYATNLDQLNGIAPTIGLTYNSQTYLSRVQELGKILNKKAEADAWVSDFSDRAKQAGEEVRAKLGDDLTVTVIESWEKELYIFGDNYARGTEILYDAMGLKRTEAVEKLVGEPGYSAISPEVLPELGGDYIVFSKSSGADNSFLETETYKNMEAVQQGRVLTADAAQFYFNDPITLEYQLEFFIDGLLGS